MVLVSASLEDSFCLQAASQLLQQAIQIRQKYMAVSHQHFSPECSQILRERSPEVTLIHISFPQSQFPAKRPRRPELLCRHEAEGAESWKTQS